MESSRLIRITEVKNGHADGNSYEIEAARYISLVKDKDCDGDLDVDVQPIYDVDGEIESYTADKFYDLPLAEQIDMCARREGERYAAHVTWEAVNA